MNNTDRNKVIALCVGGIDAQYQSILINEITQKFLHTNYKILLFQAFLNNYDGDSHYTGDSNIYNLINYKLVDAVIICYLSIKKTKISNDIFRKAKANDLPVIVIDGVIEGALNINFGYSNAITELTSHIIEKHHATRINFIGGSSDNEVSLAREKAYKDTLVAHGIPVEQKRISYAYFWNEPARKCVRNYFEKYNEMPQAFICANDSMAIGVCQEAEAMGLSVPDDVLVTGLDGIREAMNYSPKITTARYNYKEVANIILKKLEEYFNNSIKSLDDNIVVESELIYASSCGCKAIDNKLDNDLKRELYVALDYQNVVSASLINLIERVSGASSLEDTILRLHHYILKLWSEEVWFCLNESYLAEEVLYANSNYGYTIKGYELNTNCVIYRKGQVCTSLGLFKTYNMLPNFEKVVQNNTNAVMFCPLYNQDKTLGYIALTYDNNFNDGLFKYNNLLQNIVILLENSKIQSELKRTVSKLENMYIRDSMTSIYNRRGFYQLVPSLINECMIEKKYLMVISVDLDGLKPINDIHGHNEGDNAIITVAKTLNSIAINNEIVSRFGGDEYVVAGVCDSPEYAQNYVDRLNDCLDYYNKNSHKPYVVSASSGICCTPVSPEDNIIIDDLIKTADEIMYTQKQAKHYNRGR